MLTTIDNTQRIFLIQRTAASTRNFVCNLHDIPNVIKNGLETNDSFTIKHLWNGEFKRCSKKYVNEMLKCANIDYKIK